MTSGGSAARLVALSRDFRERWQQTREVWLDAKALEFDERFMRELDLAVQATVLAMERLEAVLRKIRSDCE